MGKDIVIIPGSGQIEFSGSSTHHNVLTVDSKSISITTDNFIIDGGDITAKNYIVSSSVTHMTTSLSTGNTAFGNSTDDIHVFTGSLAGTSSAGNMLHISGAVSMSSGHLYLTHTNHLVYPNGKFFIGSKGSMHFRSTYGGTSTDWITITDSHITASGDISGAISISASKIDLDGDITTRGNIYGDGATDIYNVDNIYCDEIQHRGDTNTYMQFDTDEIQFRAGTNSDKLRISAAEVSFNPSGQPYDFYIETDHMDRAFFISGSEDTIGFNTDDPKSSIDINIDQVSSYRKEDTLGNEVTISSGSLGIYSGSSAAQVHNKILTIKNTGHYEASACIEMIGGRSVPASALWGAGKVRLSTWSGFHGSTNNWTQHPVFDIALSNAGTSSAQTENYTSSFTIDGRSDTIYMGSGSAGRFVSTARYGQWSATPATETLNVYGDISSSGALILQQTSISHSTDAGNNMLHLFASQSGKFFYQTGSTVQELGSLTLFTNYGGTPSEIVSGGYLKGNASGDGLEFVTTSFGSSDGDWDEHTSHVSTTSNKHVSCSSRVTASFGMIRGNGIDLVFDQGGVNGETAGASGPYSEGTVNNRHWLKSTRFTTKPVLFNCSVSASARGTGSFGLIRGNGIDMVFDQGGVNSETADASGPYSEGTVDGRPWLKSTRFANRPVLFNCHISASARGTGSFGLLRGNGIDLVFDQGGVTGETADYSGPYSEGGVAKLLSGRFANRPVLFNCHISASARSTGSFGMIRGNGIDLVFDQGGVNGETADYSGPYSEGEVDNRHWLKSTRFTTKPVLFNCHISQSHQGTGSFGYLKAVGGIYSGTTQLSVPDYVFEPEYKLQSLEEVEKHISESKHLPNVPSMDEMDKWGALSVENRDMKLLEKIEELTLYVIDLQKQINRLKEGK